MKICFLLLLLTSCVGCIGTNQVKSGNYVKKIDNINLNFTIKGKGPVMIVGHRSSGKTGYELTLQPLESKFTMVYYDPRGTGKSDTPDTIEKYNYEYLVNEIDSLRNYLGAKKIWLFGHSDQSQIALQYAVDHPNNVAGLILSGTKYVENRDTVVQQRRNFETVRRSQSEWFNQVVKDWDYMIEHKTTTDSLGRDLKYATIKWWCYDSATSEKVIPIYDTITKTGRLKPINDQYPYQTEEQLQRLDQRTAFYQSKYPTIKTNILILNGKYDTNNPPNSVEKLHTVLPNSTLVLIDKAGHFPWVEQPEKSFAAIFKWLETVSNRKSKKVFAGSSKFIEL